MKNNLLIVLLLIINCGVLKSQISNEYISTGHPKGTLIIIGGGSVGDVIMDEFKKEVGGDSAKIVIIPTALPDEFLLRDSALIKIEKGFQDYGFENIIILHTRDTAEANKEEFIQALKTASGIFFLGGRQWRIADGFLNTKAHQEMFNLLERGGVIAGSSAGATIQGSYLARGDTKNNQIMMGDHEEGLGFITNVAIDQHVLARNRQFDMFDILKYRPQLLGIGLDESTAIVVKGDIFEVIGMSNVVIYDKSFWSREGSDLKTLPNENATFYFLQSGDKYNLRERKVIAE